MAAMCVHLRLGQTLPASCNPVLAMPHHMHTTAHCHSAPRVYQSRAQLSTTSYMHATHEAGQQHEHPHICMFNYTTFPFTERARAQRVASAPPGNRCSAEKRNSFPLPLGGQREAEDGRH